MTSTSPPGRLETLNGQQLYFEVHGTGEPLLLLQGDRDPLYPIELSIEMFKAIPNSRLWIVPNAGHGPVIGARWSEFVQTASTFLQG